MEPVVGLVALELRVLELRVSKEVVVKVLVVEQVLLGQVAKEVLQTALRLLQAVLVA